VRAKGGEGGAGGHGGRERVKEKGGWEGGKKGGREERGKERPFLPILSLQCFYTATAVKGLLRTNNFDTHSKLLFSFFVSIQTAYSDVHVVA
jgi:hypothetical protein